MNEVPYEQGLREALDSLLHKRLAILAGAGLSMAAPSGLPSAAELATHAKRRYDAMHGAARPPLPALLDEQTEFFFQNGELESVFFRTLIEPHAFGGPPNKGHLATADFLLTQAIRTAITTNVDILIEAAGLTLFGEIGAVIDGSDIATLQPGKTPLLKIHGCRNQDGRHMIWARGQIDSLPVSQRIANSELWLRANLLNHDLLIVGFWTDWDYLNAILGATLGAVTPARVMVVDLAPTDSFATKAPELFALGQRAAAFHHIRASSADFLDDLRRYFSGVYVRQVLHSGVREFSMVKGVAPDAAWLEPPDLDSETLWRIRRDVEGRGPREPALNSQPYPNETLVGLTLLQLRASGAVPDGPFWAIQGMRVRVLRAVRALHEVEAEFERNEPPVAAPDMTIAVGADTLHMAKNIARNEPQATIARGSAGRWLTRQDAVTELGL